MTSQQISELIDEIQTSNEAPMERARLLAAMLQAMHLAKIAEELAAIRTRETFTTKVRNFINRFFTRKGKS
jgi:hypothetical protein